MTNEELMALPTMGQVRRLSNGKTVPERFALFNGPDDPLSILGEDGREYMVGSAYGLRWKVARDWV